MDIFQEPSPDLASLADFINQTEASNRRLEFLLVEAVEVDPASRNEFDFSEGAVAVVRPKVTIKIVDEAHPISEFTGQGLEPICQRPVNFATGQIQVTVFREAAAVPSGEQLSGVDSPEKVTSQLTCLTEKGVQFIGRYISPNTHNFDTKQLTRDEAREASEAGFLLFTVWESLPISDAEKVVYFNRAHGLRDGEAAYRYARETLGQPGGSAIYFAVDYDATSEENTERIAPYFSAVREAFANLENPPLYKVGVYGSGLTIRQLTELGLVEFGWLALSLGFRESRHFENWHIKQLREIKVCDLDTDTNVAKSEFGQFTVSS